MTEINEEKFKLIITANQVISTDESFQMDNLSLGDNYKPLDAYFKKENGEIVRRDYNKNERKISNQTLPKIAFQIYEKQFISLSVEEKRNFPVCQYNPNSELIRGIFSSEEEFKKYRNSLEFLKYTYENDKKFIIYYWNIFSPIVFLQECLKRFGNIGDSFILIYRKKNEEEMKKKDDEENSVITDETNYQFNGYINPYSKKLIKSKNIIFRGAPGTGKSYLAKKIATDIISNGNFDNYSDLTDEQKQQIEFVQFHPSYDYSDFVEGLRPKVNDDGSMGFELQDGIFKKFVDRARKNFENANKTKEVIEKEMSVQEAMNDFFSNVELGIDRFKTITGNEFYITNIDDTFIRLLIPNNATTNSMPLNINNLRKMLESGEKFEKIKDITRFFGNAFQLQTYSYYFVLYKKIISNMKKTTKVVTKQEELKKYVFIIDEINRGEISKIFGELFFAIDPGYRGCKGEVSTQYANLHSNPNEKFYIPENVYIIGTMNDIDRSVDSFDFAMRRRFRFIELKADERVEMLDSLENDELKLQAIQKMKALNQEILNVPDLNRNYQVGASYFLKLKTVNFDELWTDYLRPLLQDYIQGMYNEDEIMKNLERAYGYNNLNQDNSDEYTQY